MRQHSDAYQVVDQWIDYLVSSQSAVAIVTVIGSGRRLCEIEAIEECRSIRAVNQRAAVLDRGVKIYTQLLQIAAEGKGLSGLAKVMSDICDANSPSALTISLYRKWPVKK